MIAMNMTNTMINKQTCPVFWTRTKRKGRIIYSDIRYQFRTANLIPIPQEKEDLPEIIYLNESQTNSTALVEGLLELGFEKVYDFKNQKTDNQISVFKRE